MSRFLILLLFVLLFLSYSNAQKPSTFSETDSVQLLHELIRDRNKDLNVRFNYANNAIKLSRVLNNDSLLLRSNMLMSPLAYGIDSLELYKRIHHENLRLSTKLKDSAIIATSINSIGYYHQVKAEYDSAYYYYHSVLDLYESRNDIRRIGEVLLNMSIIQEKERDYIGSEENAIKAISIIINLPKNNRNLDSLWILYNLLGNISTNLNQFEKAIEYHNKAIDIATDLSDNFFYRTSSLTNQAYSHIISKKYKDAIRIYSDLLENKKLISIDPETYSVVLGNLAYAKFLNENKEILDIEAQFNESLNVAERLDNKNILSGILNNMSEFLFSINKKEEALIKVNKAYNVSKKVNYTEEILKSLLILSKIEGGDEGLKYLNEHRSLSDSLLQRERAYRNKFARIEFETDQLEQENAIIEAENAQISKERLLFLLLSIGLMLSLTLLYIVITQRSRNKELRFKQEQQEANEEIYNLMLAQQDKIEEGRTKEKKRISQELHDGILGRLFGTRLSLDSLNMVSTNEAIENREQYINELKTIEQDIRKISHDLNTDFIGGSNFMDIVKNLVETQTAAYGLEYDFSDDETINWDKFSNKNKIHIYRMLQECMQNIYKHAQAKSINIGFALKNNVTLVSVEDDGVGFNIDKAKKGIGIKNINSRVEELGGQVDIKSEIGKGTSIVISIPY